MLNWTSGLSMLCCTGPCQLGGRCSAKRSLGAEEGAGPDSICTALPGPIEWIVEPDGVVTRMLLGLFSRPHSILYPGGRNVLKP